MSEIYLRCSGIYSRHSGLDSRHSEIVYDSCAFILASVNSKFIHSKSGG